MPAKDAVTYYPENSNQWRKWLIKHHFQEDGVWVILYKKQANKPTISWSEAVDEALCFGWIDSIKKTLDAERSIQFFSKRKPKSTWSKINKQKVQKLIEAGKMAPAGFESIKVAQQNGSWNLLDEVEALVIPTDLEQAFAQHKGSKEYFSGLSKSLKKMMLQWIVLAKQPTTRQKRIDEIAAHAGQGQKPKQFLSLRDIKISDKR
jgi:uncharacterized protein YdeI (YjbR/CyaY-like superfamily)